MRGPRRSLLAVLVPLAAWLAAPGSALAFGPVGADPPANHPLGAMPAACGQAPTSAACVNAAVYHLDQARASLRQPPYALPADFASLAPDRQAFILTNLDRALYGLPPVPGLTAGLDQDAAGGVQSDSDPVSSDPGAYSSTSNWAGGYPNMVAAYEGWLYDDGPGSDNLDCRSPGAAGCWGHRHDVLWSFDGATLAMGAATGTDPSGRPGYAMLIAGGDPSSYQPAYTYTWSQAVADGAGSHAYPVAPPQTGGPQTWAPRVRFRIASVTVHGHRVVVRLAIPLGARPRISLTPRRYRAVYHPAGSTNTFSGLWRGTWVLRVRSGRTVLTRSIRIR